MKNKKSRVRKRQSLAHWRTLSNRLRGELKSAWPLLKIYLVFGLTLIFLFAITMIRPVSDNVLTPFNSFLAWSTAVVLNLMGSDQVVSSGTSVSNSYFAFSIAGGCNGVFALLVVIAGMVALPMRRRPRMVGVILSIALVMSLNYIRILTLWYAGNSVSLLFDMMHNYLWEFVIIGAGSGFLYYWYEKTVTKK